MVRTYKELLEQHIEILKGLQYKTGLFAASCKKVSTGYDKSWLRDNFYECLAFQVLGDTDTVKKTYEALLKIFLRHEEKIDYAITHKPEHKHEYIHARFHPETFDEFWEDWGNKQNDAIGAILFGIAKVEQVRPKSLIYDVDHKRIIQKLIEYLRSVEFWHDYDSGMWEEDEEIHASSVGACVAGLREIRKIPGIIVDPEMIQKGMTVLEGMLPRESSKKFVDLALLSLIYPYEVVSQKHRQEILQNVEYHLLHKHGVIRYKNDHYYNKNPDGWSEEAEWTMGLSWLAIIYERIGEQEKAKELLELVKHVDTKQGLPELYFSNSPKFNENTPLGWSESLFIIALHELYAKHPKKA